MIPVEVSPGVFIFVSMLDFLMSGLYPEGTVAN
jgi:hypothetical protein